MHRVIFIIDSSISDASPLLPMLLGTPSSSEGGANTKKLCTQISKEDANSEKKDLFWCAS